MTTRITVVSLFAVGTLLCSLSVFADGASDLAKARASDPVTLGWMVGVPPPADKVIRYSDSSFYTFPQWRWSFSHWREFVPTLEIDRGSGPAKQLPVALRADLDAVTFLPPNPTPGVKAPAMSWADSLVANYTDGIVILHRGRIVYERYFGALKSEQPHVAFSVTKSFFGTLAAMLIADGSLDAKAKVSRYLPELSNSGFGDATVAQVLDMTDAIDFNENYVGDSPSMLAYRNATGFSPRPQGYTGPKSIYTFLPTVGKDGKHGEAFHYRTPNTDVVGWLIARVTGKSPATVLSERVWSRIGAEQDAFIQVNNDGVPLVGTTINMRLRDLARFGELMRLGGKFNGQQIIASAVVDDIKRGASKEAFVKAGYATLPGWSYHNLWWISHDDHGVYMARGIHGQAIYVDPKAEMVIARFASHPLAANVNLDPTSLPAYRAIADCLMTHAK